MAGGVKFCPRLLPARRRHINMDFQIKNDTIAAIASPQGLGGVGVIRISGPEALPVLQRVFAARRQLALVGAETPPMPLSFKPRRMTHGYIADWTRGEVLDEVMVVYLPGPGSYTGEDTAEIYTHGGVAVLRSVLSLVLNRGARLAEPGEYTKRAFLNGKLDLTAAEAVADVINAETEKAMLSAGRNLRGGLSRPLNVARETLLHIIMLFEASIDFPEDVDDTPDTGMALTRLTDEVIMPLADIYKNYEYGCYLKQGMRLAVVGRPNVGKSSLMNTLLRQERVLVSDEAGTTRDVVTERWNIGGFPVELADTAGIHETSQNLERLGIEKSYEVINNCDYVLFMFEAHKGLMPEDKAILANIAGDKIIGVANKTDLGMAFKAEELTGLFKQVVPVSIKNKQRLEDLEAAIIEAVTHTSQNFENMIVPNLRQTQSIERILDCMAQFEEGVANGVPAEYLCIHLEESLRLVNTILGLQVETDILDSIFSNFCIGK